MCLALLRFASWLTSTAHRIWIGFTWWPWELNALQEKNMQIEKTQPNTETLQVAHNSVEKLQINKFPGDTEKWWTCPNTPRTCHLLPRLVAHEVNCPSGVLENGANSVLWLMKTFSSFDFFFSIWCVFLGFSALSSHLNFSTPEGFLKPGNSYFSALLHLLVPDNMINNVQGFCLMYVCYTVYTI